MADLHLAAWSANLFTSARLSAVSDARDEVLPSSTRARVCTSPLRSWCVEVGRYVKDLCRYRYCNPSRHDDRPSWWARGLCGIGWLTRRMCKNILLHTMVKYFCRIFHRHRQLSPGILQAMAVPLLPRTAKGLGFLSLVSPPCPPVGGEKTYLYRIAACTQHAGWAWHFIAASFASVRVRGLGLAFRSKGLPAYRYQAIWCGIRAFWSTGDNRNPALLCSTTQ